MEDHKIQILHRNQAPHLDTMSSNMHTNHTSIINSGALHHITYLPYVLQNIKKMIKLFQILTPTRTSTLVDRM